MGGLEYHVYAQSRGVYDVSASACLSACPAGLPVAFGTDQARCVSCGDRSSSTDTAGAAVGSVANTVSLSRARLLLLKRLWCRANRHHGTQTKRSARKAGSVPLPLMQGMLWRQGRMCCVEIQVLWRLGLPGLGPRRNEHHVQDRTDVAHCRANSALGSANRGPCLRLRCGTRGCRRPSA